MVIRERVIIQRVVFREGVHLEITSLTIPKDCAWAYVLCFNARDLYRESFSDFSYLVFRTH